MLRNSVSALFVSNRINEHVGLPADIVPATYKKKRATTAAPRVKGDEGDEKPARTEDTARPTGMGRGSR